MTAPFAATSTASPASKAPSTPTIPTGQQAGAGLAKDARRAFVDRDGAAARLRVAQPQLEGGDPLAVGREARADGLARRSGEQGALGVPAQITAGMPAAPAISAARDLLRMPPSPNGEVCSPIS